VNSEWIVRSSQPVAIICSAVGGLNPSADAASIGRIRRFVCDLPHAPGICGWPEQVRTSPAMTTYYRGCNTVSMSAGWSAFTLSMGRRSAPAISVGRFIGLLKAGQIGYAKIFRKARAALGVKTSQRAGVKAGG
jgi:hypothetical protein